MTEPLLPPLRNGRSAWPAFIGDDGEHIIARGHIDPTVFACLAIALQATEVGEPDAADLLRSFADGEGENPLDGMEPAIDHRWAVERIGSADEASEDFGIVPAGAPYLRWSVGPDEPGAFPVTVLDLS